jgi:acetylornithine deacetylase/succinyl-diaminopimelate desuccinylase-like protein
MSRRPSSPAALLAEMVAVPSVNPAGDPGASTPGEARYGAWIASHLRELGADVAVRPLAPGRPTVLGVFEPAGPPQATVALVPHLDTVGVAGMTVPPFTLTRRAGRLHGRGACDTKGPTAALLWALRAWTRRPAARRPRVRWVVVATAGEEEGSAGAQALVHEGWRADFAVALEPTDLRVVHAAKGILRLWIEARGRACHGSQPQRGDNAVYRLLPLALALRDILAPELAAQRHPLLGAASLNLGVMQGGRDINIVPDSCRVGLDIRLHPGVSAEAVLARVRALVQEHAPRATVQVHRSGPSFVTARSEPWARALRRVARGWAKADWFCDANIFAGAGIPAVAFGPGAIAQAHTKDEYIRERELLAGAEAFRRFLEGT